jgi:hypothetical protein
MANAGVFSPNQPRRVQPASTDRLSAGISTGHNPPASLAYILLMDRRCRGQYRPEKRECQLLWVDPPDLKHVASPRSETAVSQPRTRTRPPADGVNPARVAHRPCCSRHALYWTRSLFYTNQFNQ